MRRSVIRFVAGGSAAVLVGGMLAAFVSILPAAAAGTVTDSPSGSTTWATDVPYGQTSPAPTPPGYTNPGTLTAPAGITVTAKGCAAAVTSTSGPGSTAGITINGVNTAGVGAVTAGAIGVLSYGASNTATSSTAVVGQTAGTASTTYTDSNGYLLPGTYTVNFEAWASGAACATSATYTLTVAAAAFTTVGGAASGSNLYLFDNSYNQSNSQTIDMIDGSGLTGTATISTSSPGTGFVCNAGGTDATVYDHECILQALPGPGNGDDSGVVGANGIPSSVTFGDPNNGATSSVFTATVYPPPICAVAPDGTGSLSGTLDTTYTTAGDPTDAEVCYNGASGPASALLTGISASGGTIFTGSNPVDGGGGLSLTIMAGPGFNFTGSVGSGEADVDTGTAGLSKQAWTGATTTSAPPSTLTSASTVASEASFKSSGDPNDTCPPPQAMIDAGLPYCFEEFEYSGAGPSAGQAALAYTGQNVPTAQTPTVALSSGSGSVGSDIGITDANNACPSTIGAGTSNQFNATYSCWYGRAGDPTPVNVTVDGIPATVTPSSPSAGDVSEANYTIGATSTVTAVTVTGGSNSVSTTGSSTPSTFSPSLVGDSVSGTDIPLGTQVVSVSGGSATLSNNATASPAAETLTFYPVVLNPPQLNAGFTIPNGTPAGDQTVDVCETTTPENGNDWEFGVQWMQPSGSLSYVSGSSGPTQVCSQTTIAVNPTTTTSTPTNANLTLGQSNTDQATVTGYTASDPTGTVSFYECGPTASAEPCTPSGSPFDTESLDGSSNPSSVTSAPYTADVSGEWCFAAVYSGDSNYMGSSDETTDECYSVGATSSSTSSSPTSSPIALGNTDSDSASVAGSIPGVDPTGTVSFYECGPTASVEPCSPSGSPFDTESLDGTSNPGSVTSGSVEPTSSGYYCFAAVYSGDSNYTGSSDETTDECVHVTPAASQTASVPTLSSIALGGSEKDNAIVTGVPNVDVPTGTVTFYECGPLPAAEACTGQPVRIGSPVSLGDDTGDTASATSASFKPKTTGTWCFLAYYSGDSNYQASSDTTTEECFAVTDTTVSLSTAPSATSSRYPAAETDTATLVGNGPGGVPTGTVTFYECGPTPTAQACTSLANPVGGKVTLKKGKGADTATAKSASFKPAGGFGYYCFGVYYSGSSAYASAGDRSTTECFYSLGPAPTIKRFSPTSGAPGTTVTITGTGLQYVTTVSIGNKMATVTSQTSTTIKITIPAGARTAKIKVSDAYGSATTANKFTVT